MVRRLLFPLTFAVSLLFAPNCSDGEREQANASEAPLSELRADCPDLVEQVSAELPIAGVPWREQLVEYAKAEVKHSAWGLSHSKRNFLLSRQIARVEKMTVDEDVLFAAAFLHDLGGLDGHSQDGVDHAVRSAELAPEILLSRGFPADKIERVKEVILAHTYYNPAPPTSPEATVFRDADVLDFLGAIGFARIASITERDAPDLAAAVRLSQSLARQLPSKLITPSAKCNGDKRAAMLDSILKTAKLETFGGSYY